MLCYMFDSLYFFYRNEYCQYGMDHRYNTFKNIQLQPNCKRKINTCGIQIDAENFMVYILKLPFSSAMWYIQSNIALAKP